jgi:hypothetical protein
LLSALDSFDSLPFAALLGPLAATEDALARLDERVRTSPIAPGWISRSHFTEACASLALDGGFVPLEDLVLHDAGRDIHTPTHELGLAQTILATRRRVATAAPGWALTPAGLADLSGQGGGVETPVEPDAAEDLFGEDALTEAFAAVDRALARTASRLRGTPEPKAEPLASHGLPDQDDDPWAAWLRLVAATESLPPTLAAALALDAWGELTPVKTPAWLGRLLGAALLRRRGKTQAHLPCLNSGLATIPFERRRSRNRTTRLIAFLDAVRAAAELGLTAHDRWAAARAVWAQKLTGRRSTSNLPALLDLVVSRPLVSVGMISGELKISDRAAQNLVAELGLRELTGRGRYRAWGIL